MSLRDWLRQEDLLRCQPALKAAGVRQPNDLCELLDDDIQEIGREADWNVLTRRRVINAVNKLREKPSTAAKVPERPSRERKSREKPKPKPKPKPKRISRVALLRDLRNQDVDDEKGRRKPAKAGRSVGKKAKSQAKSRPAQKVSLESTPEASILKHVKASTAMQNQYKKNKPKRKRKIRKKEESKVEKKEESIAARRKKSLYRDSITASMPSNMDLRKSRGRGYTVDPSILEVTLYDIPERLPPLNSLENVCDAVRYELIDCQTPEIPTQTQREIGQEVQELNHEMTSELVEQLTQEHDINPAKMKSQIKLIEKFSRMIGGHRAELEHLYEKLVNEKPEQDTDLLSRMDVHREVLSKHKDFAEEYLSALTQLEASKEKLSVIDHKTFAEMKSMKQPPKVLKDLITGICMIFGMSKPSWRQATSFICGRDMRNRLLHFDPKDLDPKARSNATKFIMANMDSFDPDRVEAVSKKAVSLADWVEGLNGLFEIFAKLEKFPDGERILNEIETAYAELRKNKAIVAKIMQEENCWQNVLDQLRWDIQLLKQCENAMIRITTRRSKMIKKLEEYETLPEYADVTLPEGYKQPYEQACKKIRTQFGELTEVEFRFVFSVVKKHFMLLIHCYKTYAALEGKNGQGLCGMSSMMWGICCKSMDLPKLSEDESQDFVYEIFNLSSVQTMESNRHSVDFATLRGRTQKRNPFEEVKEENVLTGVWQCGESTSRLWTIEAKLGGVFTGFIGSEKYATIDGESAEDDELVFTIAWGRDSQKGKLTAKCKATWVDSANIRVKYNMSNRKKGYWILQKTGAKVRTQNVGTSALHYDSFVEAVIRMSIYIWIDLPAWEAIEALMDEHIAPKSLINFDVMPETDQDVLQYLKRREVKSVLVAIFKKYSTQRNKLLTYPKWEELVRRINGYGTGTFEQASFRTMQFSFFTSIEMFPHDGPLNELSYTEFTFAVARLAFMMVISTKAKRGSVATKPKLLSQCQTMIAWLTEVKKR